MSSRTSDVSLVIRAKDEAQKTVDAITGALNKLYGAQEKVAGSADKTGANITDLAATLSTLDKAYAKLTGSAESAEAAFARQKAAIAGQKETLQNLQTQATAAAAVLEKLQAKQSTIGPQPGGPKALADQIKLVTQEYNRLETQAGKLASTIAAQESALGSSASSLQRIGSNANAVEIAIAKARTELDAQTRAYEKNAAAAKANADIKPRIEVLTGVTGTRATDAGATFSALAEQALKQEAAEAASIAASLEAAAKSQADINRLAEAAQTRAAISRVDGSDRPAATSAGATFSALDEREAAATKATVEQATALQRLRDTLEPVAVIERNMAAQQAILNQGFRDGKVSADELTKSTALLNAGAERAKLAVAAGQKNQTAGLFGLRGYELTNLSYQLNDIATQLASGTSLSQTLAQQGGQILQLFPKVGGAILEALRGAPVLLGSVGVGLAGLAVTLAHTSDQMDRLRQITGILTLSSDGFTGQAKAVRDAEDALERYGLTADQALKIVRIGVHDGLDAAEITKFGTAAKNLSDILGVDAVTAANQLSAAFSGGFAAVQDLDKATNLYTASQLETIKALFDQGKAHDAVAKAAEIAYGVLGKGADAARGPWAEAFLGLGNAWTGLLNTFADTSFIKGAFGAIEELANRVTGALKSINATGADAIKNQLIALEAKYSGVIQLGSKNGKTQYVAPKDDTRFQGVADKMNKLKAQYDALTAAQTKAGNNAVANATADAQLQQKKIAALKEQSAQQAVLTGQVTKQADIEARVAAARKAALEKAQKDSGPNPSHALQAAQNEVADAAALRERVKLNKELVDYQKQQANEAERAARAADSMQGRTAALLKQQEGFRPQAYYDRNAFRVGYGSDTTTAADGTVSRVTSTTTTDQTAALRDLDRRIKEFSDTVKRQIGGDRYNAFSPQQQAALNSIAYNYGALPTRILDAVKTGSAQQIATAVRGLGNDNGGINRGRRNTEAAMLDTPNIELEQSTANIEKERLATQKKFNDGLSEEERQRRQAIADLQAQAGLRGEALIAQQRRAAIDDAIAKAQDERTRKNEELVRNGKAPLDDISPEQLETIRQSTGAYYDLANAKEKAAAKRQAVDQPVTDLSAQREAVARQIELGQQSGGSTAGLEDTYKSLTDQINAARDAQIALYESIIAGGDAAAAENNTTVAALQAQILAIQNAKAESRQLGTQFIETGKQINESISKGGAEAFDRFSQSLVEGRNVFASLKNAFLQFASSFLREIAQMIALQVIFNAIGGAIGSGNGGAGGGIAGLIGGLIKGGSSLVHTDNPVPGMMYHSGGVVGAGGSPRALNPAWYANPLKYHSGGVAGLAPNEVPAVLQRGEEVLTAADPRHRANGGGAAAPQDVKIVNLYDPAQVVSQMLGTRAGVKAILNVVSDNPAAFKAAMG